MLKGLKTLGVIRNDRKRLGIEFNKEVNIIEKELKALEIIMEEFEIETFENANGDKAISIYSNTDKYAVVKVVSQEKYEALKEVLCND